MLEKIKMELSARANRVDAASNAWSDGYRTGADDALELLKKYTYGGTKQTAGPRQPITELADLQESELRPAVKFLEQDVWDLLTKITQEYAEVMDAYEEYAKNGCNVHLGVRIVDLQFACETALAKIHPDVEKRREIRKFVIRKNTNQGYYGEGK